MRDNKKLNKTNMILSFIPYLIIVAIGAVSTVSTILGILKHYGIIEISISVSNFNWVSIIFSFIISFCFIYFPIKTMIRYIHRFKTNNYSKEINTVTISSQSTPVNLVDVEMEHNRDLDIDNMGGFRQNIEPSENKVEFSNQKTQINTKPNTFLIKFLSVIVGIFVFAAILCFINAIVPNPWMTGKINGEQMNSRESWKIGLVILCFLLPVILWLVSLLKTHFANKYNKPIKQSEYAHYHMAFAVIIALACWPFILINDSSKFTEPVGIFYVSFLAFLFILFTYGYIHDVINNRLNKKLFDNKLSMKNKAKYMGCKYSNSTTQSINGVPTRLNVKYKIRFSYTDENGVERRKTSSEEYTFNEVAYLKQKQEFDILSHKNRAIIVENLVDIKSQNDANIDIEQKNTKTFLPSFARKNRWLLAFIFSLVMVAILEIAGIGMLSNSKGSNTSGMLCTIFGVILLGWSIYYYLPSILAEYKGKEMYGKLLKLEVDHRRNADHDTNRKYAVVELNGEIKNILLLYDEWYSILSGYIGKEIPLKVFRKTAVVDFQKMYSDLI